MVLLVLPLCFGAPKKAKNFKKSRILTLLVQIIINPSLLVFSYANVWAFILDLISYYPGALFLRKPNQLIGRQPIQIAESPKHSCSMDYAPGIIRVRTKLLVRKLNFSRKQVGLNCIIHFINYKLQCLFSQHSCTRTGQMSAAC